MDFFEEDVEYEDDGQAGSNENQRGESYQAFFSAIAQQEDASPTQPIVQEAPGATVAKALGIDVAAFCPVLCFLVLVSLLCGWFEKLVATNCDSISDTAGRRGGGYNTPVGPLSQTRNGRFTAGTQESPWRQGGVDFFRPAKQTVLQASSDVPQGGTTPARDESDTARTHQKSYIDGMLTKSVSPDDQALVSATERSVSPNDQVVASTTEDVHPFEAKLSQDYPGGLASSVNITNGPSTGAIPKGNMKLSESSSSL